MQMQPYPHLHLDRSQAFSGTIYTQATFRLLGHRSQLIRAFFCGPGFRESCCFDFTRFYFTSALIFFCIKPMLDYIPEPKIIYNMIAD